MTLRLVVRFPAWDIIFPKGFQTGFLEAYFILSFAINSLQVFTYATISGKQEYLRCNQLDLVNAFLRTIVFVALWFLRDRLSFPIGVAAIFALDLFLTVVRLLTFARAHYAAFGTSVIFVCWRRFASC